MNPLAAYYTETSVSRLLVSQFQLTNAGQVLDLGAGHGSLLNAALQRWPNSRVVAAELDPDGYKALQRKHPTVSLVQTDGLQAHTCANLAVLPGSIDIAVCNPPYLTLKEVEPYRWLLEEATLPGCAKLPRITTDIVFLAQNLRMLRRGGELGIILPDSVVSGQLFEALRQDLLTHHDLFAVIQMPDNTFRGTEARTYILLLRRGGRTKVSVPIYQAADDMSLESYLQIPKEGLAHRMDYSYWAWRETTPWTARRLTLTDIGADVQRGNITRKDCLGQGLEYFHTSDFPGNTGVGIHFNRALECTRRIAAKGDILLARVGSRCIGRVAVVKKGSRVITDCIYRVRVASEYIQPLIEAFSSSDGQAWLKAHARGVCAQVIRKSDLLCFPLRP